MKEVFIFIICVLFFCFSSCEYVEPRIASGCSVVQSTIYCFGGYLEFHMKDIGGNTFHSPTNEHVAIDLTDLSNNTKQLQWQKKSNTVNISLIDPIGSMASSSFYLDNSYYILGGWPDNLNILPSIKNRFIVYHPSINRWEPLFLPASVNYFMDVSTVNLGNDTIWVWGNLINDTNEYISQALYTFDYKKNIWYSQYSLNGLGRIYHSVTLASNSVIYIMGGYFQSDQAPVSQYANFSQVIAFDTKSFQWSVINATGDRPSSRIFHSTTKMLNNDLLVVYGGIQLEKSQGFTTDDICYIYNSTDNSFKKVSLLSDTNRAGHFATMYDTNYLILAFGFVRFNLPADNLSVLNMTDIYNPTWLISFNATLNAENNNELNQGSKIAIIVVLIISFSAGIFGVIFYIRFKKMKQRRLINEQK